MNDTCIFCKQTYHTIATFSTPDNSHNYDQVVKCYQCKMTTYFKLGEVITRCYDLNHTKYQQIIMNVIWNKTSLIFIPKFPEEDKVIDFTGTWVNTPPDQANHLADRLNKLLTFL